MNRYEPIDYVAVPRRLVRNNKGRGKWHQVARKLAPGLAIEVGSYVEARMLDRAAKQLGMPSSINKDCATGKVYVGIPE